MKLSFRRIAVVNRGEPAMRLIHAARELNQEHGCNLEIIAFYTEPDRHSMFVREADETYYLGPAMVSTSEGGARRSAYLDYARLREAIVATRAEAVWVGWGFVAEHAEFAELCSSLGVVFVGPSPDVMRALGDKISAKRLAENAGVPVAPWSGGPVNTQEEALSHARRIGFPLVIKATAGGGGRGIRKVYSEAEFALAFDTARSEAGKAFGDDTVFLEKMVDAPRHVEVQILADHHGTTWACGVRDCSVQRRNQKVVEEAPSLALSQQAENELRAAAVRLAQTAGYTNAGTVECLYMPEIEQFYFMEMNTRLQVEHPVTEMTTGLDLVKLQLFVASGGHLPSSPPKSYGHAIEVRLNAEDPDAEFAPAPGKVQLFRLPSGPGLRVDTGVGQGDEVPPDFDSMVAKLIVFAANRDEAIARMRRALMECSVVIEGGSSNKAFLLRILEDPTFVMGQCTTAWLDEMVELTKNSPRRYATVALVQAAIDVYEQHLAVERMEFLGSAVRGRLKVRQDIGLDVELTYAGQAYTMRVQRTGREEYLVVADDARIPVSLYRQGRYESRITCGGRRHKVISVTQGLMHHIEVNGVTHRVSREEGGVIRAPAPALILKAQVMPGQTVTAGEPVILLEAMKMEMQVRAPFSGKVREVVVSPNMQVAAGAALIHIEPTEDGAQLPKGERLCFDNYATNSDVPSEASENGASRCIGILEQLARYMLGYDISESQANQLVDEAIPLLVAHGSDNHGVMCAVEKIFDIFVDVSSLYRRSPAFDRQFRAVVHEENISPAENFINYLRRVEEEAKDLPEEFKPTLLRALAHYGVSSLVRTAELEDALSLIHKAYLRMSHNVRPLLRLLERPWKQVDAVAGLSSNVRLHAMLDRIIDATHEGFQPVSDLARHIRFRYFDKPLFEAQRTAIYEEMEARIEQLLNGAQQGGRDEFVQALIDSPQPMLGFLSRWMLHDGVDARRLALELFFKRFYGERGIDKLSYFERDGALFGCIGFTFKGKRVTVLATAANKTQLSPSIAAIAAMSQDFAPDEEVMVDIILDIPGQSGLDALASALLNDLSQCLPESRIGRVCVSAVDAKKQVSISSFTYASQLDGTYGEVKNYRGMHPMIAGRLELWRLRNFHIERLNWVDEIYLFRGVARDNARDERLFAFVNIRDMTPVRNEKGEIVQLPNLEQRFMEALATLRDYRYGHSEKSLHWNRVLLYVWPPVSFKPEELHAIANRMASATRNLGIEKVVVRARLPGDKTGGHKEVALHLSMQDGKVVRVRASEPGIYPIRTLTPYAQKVAQLRRRGLQYPYEIIRMLAPSSQSPSPFSRGEFQEHDLDGQGELVPVERPYGHNTANIVVGVVRNYLGRYADVGITRVMLLSDPSQEMGSLAEPECIRVIKAIDLAESMGAPVEWFPISAGAKIAMDSGTENLDWTARVLKRLIHFTQAGGEVNVVVAGINVGAQSYWNAEATMLTHTRGILIMTPEASMVLTGKMALDYSGSISADDHQGIGGFERIMGPNGQAQYYARDMAEACQLLLRHYELTYVHPDERFPRRFSTEDPSDRNVMDTSYSGADFSTVGEIFADSTNPGRKKPFDIRAVMQAVIDQDCGPPLERWAMMRNAETAVVWEAVLGGHCVCLLGIESRRLSRPGFVPGDGPDHWTGGTLFPLSSKKVARAINAASGKRPVVVLANLSGFDGSPESLRKLQLEYGAEIGRAVVNFDGPMVFCVISRYHGGAYVVFSRHLNENLEVAALDGAYASVIGGAPAAAVVFSREVKARVYDDERIKALQTKLDAADERDRPKVHAEYSKMFQAVYVEKIGQMADEFDAIHSVHRAKRVESIDHIVEPKRLRPYLVEALERGVTGARNL